MLIIHIGTQKTGTSALQNFLFHNRQSLLEQGIRYVEAGRDNGRRSSHGQLAQALINGTHSTFWQELREELAGSSGKINLMSAEGFWFCDPAAIRSEIPDSVDLKIVVYLRRQDQYLQSLWKQAVVGGRKHDFSTWRTRVPERGDYLSIIERWASQFGMERLLIRPYESETGKGNTIADFCEIIGAKVGSTPRDAKRNPSPRIELLHFIRALNQLDLEFDRHQFFRELIGRNSKYIRTCDVLPFKDARVLMEGYAEQNEVLSDKYYRHKTPPLFSRLIEYNDFPVLDLQSKEFFEITVDMFDVLLEFAMAGKLSRKPVKGAAPGDSKKRESHKGNRRKSARENLQVARKNKRAKPNLHEQ